MYTYVFWCFLFYHKQQASKLTFPELHPLLYYICAKKLLRWLLEPSPPELYTYIFFRKIGSRYCSISIMKTKQHLCLEHYSTAPHRAMTVVNGYYHAAWKQSKLKIRAYILTCSLTEKIYRFMHHPFSPVIYYLFKCKDFR